MKANRLAKDEGGDFGIGTMIIFIAMIVVAVVAATVLIETQSKLRSSAEATGNEAITQVSSGVNLKSVVGDREDTTFLGGMLDTSSFNLMGRGNPLSRESSMFQRLNLLLELRAGSVPINLDKTVIRVATKAKVVDYSGQPSEGAEVRQFVEVAPVRDPEGSIARNKVLNRMGDMASVTLDISDLGIGPGETFSISIIPDVGGMPTTVSVRTPLTFAESAVQIQLYP